MIRVRVGDTVLYRFMSPATKQLEIAAALVIGFETNGANLVAFPDHRANIYTEKMFFPTSVRFSSEDKENTFTPRPEAPEGSLLEQREFTGTDPLASKKTKKPAKKKRR